MTTLKMNEQQTSLLTLSIHVVQCANLVEEISIHYVFKFTEKYSQMSSYRCPGVCRKSWKLGLQTWGKIVVLRGLPCTKFHRFWPIYKLHTKSGHFGVCEFYPFSHFLGDWFCLFRFVCLLLLFVFFLGGGGLLHPIHALILVHTPACLNNLSFFNLVLTSHNYK